MSDTESQIFRTAYRFLADHASPLQAEDASVDWWVDTANEVGRLSAQWNHPLMNHLLVGIYEYLSEKGGSLGAGTAQSGA